MRKLLLVLMLLILAGCGETLRLPPPLSPAERSKLDDSQSTNEVVGIVQYSCAPKYSDKLIVALRQTRIFKKVDYLDALDEKPTLIAAVNKGIYNNDLRPAVGALFGFGIVFPTYSDKCEYGYDFLIWDPARPNRKARVNAVFAEDGYGGIPPVGILVALANLSPNWSRDPYQSPRLIDRLKLKIVIMLEKLEAVPQADFYHKEHKDLKEGKKRKLLSWR